MEAVRAIGDKTGVAGVLGGMGPLATIDFMRKVVGATPAASDQDHVPMVVSSIPQVPDRTPPLEPALRVHWALPTATEMLELVMPGIAAVKAGVLDQGAALLNAAAQVLVRRGAQALVLGCTEIPIMLGAAHAGVPVIDASASSARRAVAWSLEQRRRVSA